MLSAVIGLEQVLHHIIDGDVFSISILTITIPWLGLLHINAYANAEGSNTYILSKQV